MHSRRRFLQLSLAALAAAAQTARGQDSALEPHVWLPIVRTAPPPPPTPAPTPPPAQLDAPILGLPSGLAQQAYSWLVEHAAPEYTPYDIWAIVNAYQQIGDSAELDWFLALAQMCHETGSMTSWWSGRPRRNPAGIGVTGRTQIGTPDTPPIGSAWAWDGSVWREGVSFATWVDHGIPAHLGRLLAYALRDDQASPAQLDLIRRALAVRPLPASLRGVAPTIVSLNGRWAVPGTSYGQRIMDLAERMRLS